MKNSVEYYLKAEDPSPCAMCGGLTEEKEACSETCENLARWQVSTGALPRPLMARAVRQVGANGHRLCSLDGGVLAYEDGVIFCVKCLQVYARVRFIDEDRPTARSRYLVGYLLDLRWSVAQIAGIMGLCEKHVAKLAREKGYNLQKMIGRAEKIAIVEYMLETDSKQAGEKFGLHPETINKYARDLGLGTFDRYRALKKEAKVLYEQGETVSFVAKVLGVNRRTAGKWRYG